MGSVLQELAQQTLSADLSDLSFPLSKNGLGETALLFATCKTPPCIKPLSVGYRVWHRRVQASSTLSACRRGSLRPSGAAVVVDHASHSILPQL